MSAKQREYFAKTVKQVGIWAGSRHLRNRGVPFEQAYEIIFNRKPRK